MLAKFILSFILYICMISLMYGVFEGIRAKDDKDKYLVRKFITESL